MTWAPSATRNAFGLEESPSSASDRLSVAVGDHDPVLQVAVHVHQPPLGFPFFTLFIKLGLPRLVESREPEVVGAVLQGLAYPVLEQLIDAGNVGDGALAARGGPVTAGRTAVTRPTDFSDDVALRFVLPVLLVVVLPETPGPGGGFGGRHAGEERVDIAAERVSLF